MLDLSRNNLTTVANLTTNIDELYLTGNQISDYESVVEGLHPLKDSLMVVYLDMNGLDGSIYIEDLFSKFEKLTQVDQTFKKKTKGMTGEAIGGVKSALKKSKEHSELEKALEEVLK